MHDRLFNIDDFDELENQLDDNLLFDLSDLLYDQLDTEVDDDIYYVIRDELWI
jgi:hypothetical protein